MLSLILRSIRALTHKERTLLTSVFIIFIVALSGSSLMTYYKQTSVGPATGGTYREGMVGQPITLNPVLAGQNDIDRNLIHLVFSPLKTLIQDLTTSDDYMTWNITLKSDILWSDGNEFGAEDVLFTIKTIQDPETHSPLAPIWAGAAVNVISSRELRITLTEPYAFFEHTITDLRVIPEHIFGIIPSANLRLSNYNFAPVGNGPYRFAGYEKRDDGFISRYVLERNPYFTDNTPFLDEIEIVFFIKNGDLIKAFNARKITGFGTEDISVLQEITLSKTIHRLSLPRYFAVFLNTNANAALKELAVRNALIASTDRAQLVDIVFEGNAEPIEGPLAPGAEGYLDESMNTSSPQGAIELLEKAGWQLGEDGIRAKTIGKTKTRLSFILSFPETPMLEATAALLETQWRQIGVELQLEPLNPNAIDQALKNRSYQMLLFGNLLAGTDLFSFWHSSQRFSPGLNFALYQNSKVDALLEKARKEADASVRAEILQNATNLIRDDAPAVFLFNPSYLFVTVPKLLGVNDAAGIQTPSHRFDDIASWYLRNGRVFK